MLGLEATCQADSQNTAANYIQNNDGTALNTSAWAEGDTYTLTCKQGRENVLQHLSIDL